MRRGHSSVWEPPGRTIGGKLKEGSQVFLVAAASTVLAEPEAASSSGGGFAGLILPLLLIGVVFYMFLIRPNNRRRQQQQSLQRSVAVGQEVMTTAGMYATVVGLEDDVVVLEVSPGVRMRYARGAIARVIEHDTEVEEGQTGTDSTSS
jgi:preprotein translocase subunit YajC